MIVTRLIMLAFLFCLTACEKEELHFKEGDMEITVNPGEQWLHDFPLFLGLKQKNTPQFAIWIEDISGNYLTTIFVTHKIATEGCIITKTKCANIQNKLCRYFSCV